MDVPVHVEYCSSQYIHTHSRMYICWICAYAKFSFFFSMMFAGNTYIRIFSTSVSRTLTFSSSCKSFSTMANFKTEIDLSLDRIKRVLVQLDSPQTKFPIIHVAGTNAKGSTVQYLRSILQNVIGLRTGTFTTPHLIEERDSCQVNGQTIDSNIWHHAGEIVREADNHFKEHSSSSVCTPFELLTARCFVAFNLLTGLQRPEILLIEVGMGGALDATNVFDDKQVLASVITSIDFDHQAFLGNTLTEISRQKAGIIKQSGLCIIADQRRKSEMFAEIEPDCTKISARPDNAFRQRVDDSDEIIESIRAIAHERNARLVQSYTPWQTLKQAQSEDQINWKTSLKSHVRFSPTLSPSKIHVGNYVARTGDNVVAGPTLHVQATRASLMGSHSALQTLWSIARDETPCGLGMDGSDEFEEVRLRIAFSLRDELSAKRSIEECISSTRLAGRAEWMKIDLPKDAESDQISEGTTGHHGIFALVDGAHNTAAITALRQYVDTCIHSRSSSFKQDTIVTVTWILAFSKGKPLDEMVQILLTDTVNSDEGIQERVSSLSLNEKPDVSSKVRLQHRIGCVPFTTPVEGMPWVQSMPAEEICFQFNGKPNVVEARPFENLSDALIWAAQTGDGHSPTQNLTDTWESPIMIVIAGSLYLVSDVHRLNTNH